MKPERFAVDRHGTRWVLSLWFKTEAEARAAIAAPPDWDELAVASFCEGWAARASGEFNTLSEAWRESHVRDELSHQGRDIRDFDSRLIPAAEAAPPEGLTGDERDELDNLLAAVILPTFTPREREIARRAARAALDAVAQGGEPVRGVHGPVREGSLLCFCGREWPHGSKGSAR